MNFKNQINFNTIIMYEVITLDNKEKLIFFDIEKYLKKVDSVKIIDESFKMAEDDT